MKILAIIGGRKNGLSEAMAKVALKAANDAGADEITAVRLLDLNISNCSGCNNCMLGLIMGKGRGECVIKDDFQWLENQILDSDGIIVSLPIFEKTVPGYYKTLCDRLGPGKDAALHSAAQNMLKQHSTEAADLDRRIFKRRAVSYIAHGGSDWNQSMMPVMMHFGIPMNMETVDQLLIPWDNDKILDLDTIERLKVSGKHIVEQLKTMPQKMMYIGRKGQCPMCHNDVFVLGEKVNETCCSLCGIKGTLKIDEKGYVDVEFSDDILQDSHTTMKGKFNHLNDLRTISNMTPEKRRQVAQKQMEMCQMIELSRP